MLETAATSAWTSATPAAAWWQDRSGRLHSGTAESTPARLTASRPSSAAGALREAARRRGGVRVASTFTGPYGHRASRSRRDIECELPHVVARRAAIRAERVLGALASNAHDATRSGTCRRRLRCTWLRLNGTWLRLTSTTTPGLRVPARNARLLSTDGDRHEFPVLGHRVLVFLPQVFPFDQHIDTGWKGVREVRVLGAVKRDSARVLLAAKNELRFLFAAGHVAPYWHRDGHERHHDRNHDKQGRHRISALACLTV